MKKKVLFTMLLFPLSLFAQSNDMFYVPQKEVKQTDVAKILSATYEYENDDDWGIADNGNTRDVDEYNRRGAYYYSSDTVAADDVETLLAECYTEEEEDTEYDYTVRIVRFHSPTCVMVSSPWYWDVYPSIYYYDDYYHYDIGVGFSFAWNCFGLGLGFYTGWHYPFYTHFYAPPAPRYIAAHRPLLAANVRRPVVNASRVPSNVKRPVATMAKNGKEPAKGNKVQVDRSRRAGNGGSSTYRIGRNNVENTDKSNGSDTKKVNVSSDKNSGKDRTQSRGGNRTYNRPSSTGSSRKSTTIGNVQRQSGASSSRSSSHINSSRGGNNGSAVRSGGGSIRSGSSGGGARSSGSARGGGRR